MAGKFVSADGDPEGEGFMYVGFGIPAAAILSAALDSDVDIGWGYGFSSTIAFLALWLFTIFSAIVLYVSFFVEDPDGLPPGFKAIGLFYRHPAERHLNNALTRSPSAGRRGSELEKMTEDLRTTSVGIFGRYGSMIKERRLRKMKAKLDAESKKIKAASEVMYGAEGYELHKRAEEVLRDGQGRKESED
jgi:hypothetical protein